MQNKRQRKNIRTLGSLFKRTGKIWRFSMADYGEPAGAMAASSGVVVPGLCLVSGVWLSARMRNTHERLRESGAKKRGAVGHGRRGDAVDLREQAR
jgi:hypothetical protein